MLRVDRLYDVEPDLEDVLVIWEHKERLNLTGRSPLEAAGTDVLRTDERGDLVVVEGGGELRVVTGK